MKKSKEHLGQKIKRLRAYRGLTQEDLARSLGKTRSLVSFFERTGNINKYTLQEISNLLNTTPEELENDHIQLTPAEKQGHTSTGPEEKLITQLQQEIVFLKETIHQQWLLLKELSKSK
ncbi:MAG: helix-turn-helix transcriptional regulator [Chitinophagaceae bacterium]|nr:helix-turn-helix transcriptional regulator [Chitinophagaceae bacterium]